MTDELYDFSNIKHVITSQREVPRGADKNKEKKTQTLHLFYLFATAVRNIKSHKLVSEYYNWQDRILPKPQMSVLIISKKLSIDIHKIYEAVPLWRYFQSLVIKFT